MFFRTKEFLQLKYSLKYISGKENTRIPPVTASEAGRAQA